MKKRSCLIILTFLIFIKICPAQYADNDFSRVDEYVQKLGGLEKYNVATIADTLTRNFSDKYDKARAIFYWIAHNISYDIKAVRSNDNSKSDPVIVIQSRKATPFGFATLYQEMASIANIRCLVVDGYVKRTAEEINNKSDDMNHSWNVVQLGQSPTEWYYIDAAKAAGIVDNTGKNFIPQFTSEYFFANKKLFNLDHYPDNSAWQLEAGPKGLKEFYALPVIGNAAYTIGLTDPEPSNGYLKTKTKNSNQFKFRFDYSVSITAIEIIMGDERKKSKPVPMNFTANGGTISFSYTFKNEDQFPVRILADGKEILTYMVEVNE